jgi:hypothetical protein
VIGDDEALQGLVLLRDLRAVEEAEAEQRLSVSQLLVRLAQVA